jgi:two-component system response regulator AtoC
MAERWILLFSDGTSPPPPGYRRAASWPEVRATLAGSAPSALMVDIESLRPGDLQAFFRSYPDVAVFVLTDDAHLDEALTAVTLGALDYFRRPVSQAELELALQRVRAPAELTEAPTAAPAAVTSKSPAMQRVHELVGRAAASDATVLIRGETGTGKDLIAREIHRLSSRSSGPFVKVHAAALPDSLLESELFGYEKGAFTGATRRKAGRVELAENGTLFLDEIGDISAALQVRLLRVLQDKEFERVGGTESLAANVRFLAATHRDLSSMVAAGEFREDLLYRLNVITVWLPPLRARREDIAALAQEFCASFAAQHKRPAVTLEDAALAFLAQQRWPGNVRQLQHLIERIVLLSDAAVITAEALKGSLREEEAFKTGTLGRSDGAFVRVPSVAQDLAQARLSSVRPLREDVARAERHALEKALAQSKGNRTLAARLLGISRQTLYSKLEEYGITE